jgi:uncharacterized phage protein (TIGR02218 family)
MSRTFFATPLGTAAAWWRVYRRDGVALAFTTHDRDLWFDGLLHRAAPGVLPSAIRRTIGFEDDESEVEGALSHGAIRAEDLSAGRFDGARVESGVVDWQTLEAAALYGGSIAGVSQEATSFSAQLRSAKADLAIDPVPLSSPTCRARFCGPGCTLNPAAHETVATLIAFDADANRATFNVADHAPFALGELRFLDGAQAGLPMRVLAVSSAGLTLDRPLDTDTASGLRARLREGCDRTIATCSGRFSNAVNFRGEPFLPGNDLLAQYPIAR